MFADSLRRGDSDEVQIPVERIRGPVLLASGADDRKWPAALMCERAIERFRRHSHPYPAEHVSYEDAGHWLPSAHLPTRGVRGRLAAEIGGSPEGTATAQAERWPRMFRFLAAIPPRSAAQ